MFWNLGKVRHLQSWFISIGNWLLMHTYTFFLLINVHEFGYGFVRAVFGMCKSPVGHAYSCAIGKAVHYEYSYGIAMVCVCDEMLAISGVNLKVTELFAHFAR